MELQGFPKFDWNDVTLVPSVLSVIESRSEINPYLQNGKLPIFSAPMDTVIGHENADTFWNIGITPVMPRGLKYEDSKSEFKDQYFWSYGLDEIIDVLDNNGFLPPNVLIDIANGHMMKLWKTSSRIKQERKNITLMIGNIANPDTFEKYCEIGVDWVRVGIGGGSACTTSANTSVHYPMASLVSECSDISKRYANKTRIVADGGFKNFADIIKALALGSDSVMLGSMLSKSLESISEPHEMVGREYVKLTNEEALELYNNGGQIWKKYRGMSTKEVQKTWGKEKLKTAEGISMWNKVEYRLDKWVENLTDYLKSSMSYCNSKNLSTFKSANWTKITERAYNRFNK